MRVSIKLRAEDPATGEVVGWRRHSAIVAERPTWYNSLSSALKGIESAEARWPQYRWRAYPWRGQWSNGRLVEPCDGKHAEVEVVLPRRPKPSFTREEVTRLLTAEREGCALICEDEERIRTAAGQAHPEESASRDRCFAAARAAINCALGIRSERPSIAELLK